MAKKDAHFDLFIKKAEAVGTVVKKIKNFNEAIAYTIDLCEKKPPCQILIAEGNDIPLREERIIAAPSLAKKDFKELELAAKEKKMVLLESGLREYLAGLDIGLTYADHGIADTGSLVINCPSEELRLATMISEYHVAVLPMSKIVESLDKINDVLVTYMNKADYTAFITGPSRTADIERVLSIGVHGPLALHILLLEDV